MKHFKLHVMLGLRSLLEQLHARADDVEHNRQLIARMFGTSDSNKTASSDNSDSIGVRSSVSLASESSATSRYVSSQRAVHSRLTRLSELYTGQDARTVRIDVSQLDQLFDLADDACASFLFNLRPDPPIQTKSTTQRPQRESDEEDEEADDYSQQQKDMQEKDEEAADAVAIIDAPRRLLLRAVATHVTTAELRYLYSLLPSRLRGEWKQIDPG